MQLQPATLLQGRYRVVALIAQGGMGAVYRAVDERLGSTVALKQTLMSDPALRAAFEREARLLAALQHPTLPVVSDHFSEAGDQFLVMQFIPGDDLATLLRDRGGPFPLAEVLVWADSLLDALDYLHRQRPPIIHRDIKPQNLKLTARRELVLLDFGLAKGLAGSGTTSSPSLFGYTPQYAPLEQIQGSGTDARSDLYALGATFYELLTGTPPPDALTRSVALVRGESDPLRPALALNSQIPPPVSHLLGQALALNPDLRPPSAATLRAALRTGAQQTQVLTGQVPPTLVAQEVSVTGTTIAVGGGIAKRRPGVLPIGLGAVLLFVALIAFWALGRPSDTGTLRSPSAEGLVASLTATPAHELGTTRANPLSRGAPVTVAGWQVEVLDMVRGEPAYERLRKANSNNKPPPAGTEYLLLNLRAISRTEQTALSRGDVQIIGARDYAYNGFAAVPPTPLFEATGKVAAGQTIEGWSAYLVGTDEPDLVLAVGSLITGAARFLALTEGAHFAPDRTLLEITPNRVGADWHEPAVADEQVITDDWALTLLQMERGETAWQRIFAANRYNKPPPAGFEYVAAFVRVRRIADDDQPNLISGGYFSAATGTEEVQQPSVVAPEPELNAQLFPGGTAEGWVVVVVPVGNPEARLVFRNNSVFFRSDDFNTRYFALNW